MKKLDEKVLKAMVGEQSKAYFQTIMDWLGESWCEQIKENTWQEDDTKLKRGQGKAQVLEEILMALGTAPNDLASFQARQFANQNKRGTL